MYRVALLLAALLVSACAGSAPAEGDGRPTGTEAATRTVQHSAGTTEVPAEPRRIVTTTDQNALLPLLELGVTPVASAGLVAPDGTTSFRRTEGFDTGGIAFTGAYGEPNLEAVTAQQPDLIVGFESDEEFYDDLSRIAPTVLVQVFDRPLSEALLEFADVVGERGRAEELSTQYEARVADLRAQLGDRIDTLSVSVVSAGDPGTFYRADVGQALGTVTNDLGLLRPAAQEADTGQEAQSLEQLSTRDADVLLVVDYSGDAGGDPALQGIVESPAYRRLAAVRAGQAHVVDGSRTVGAAWARMDAFLDVLEEHLLPARDDVVRE